LDSIIFNFEGIQTSVWTPFFLIFSDGNFIIYNMKKMHQLTATSLLVCSMSLPLPLQADMAIPSIGEKPVPIPAEGMHNSAQSKTEANQIVRFTLQHRFNGGEPLPKDTIEIPVKAFAGNPGALWKAIKNNFSKHLEKQGKPAEIDTRFIFLPFPEKIQTTGQLPSSDMKTTVNSDGTGKSTWNTAAFQLKFTEDDHKGTLNWHGGKAQFSFTDKFESISSQFEFLGMTFTTPEGLSISVGNSTGNYRFNAQFEATEMNFTLPVDVRYGNTFSLSLGETTFSQTGKFNQIALNLPSLKMREKDSQVKMNLRDMTFNYNVEKSNTGLELGSFRFKMGNWDVMQDAYGTSGTDWVMTMTSEEKEGVVNYLLESQTGKMNLSIGSLPALDFDKEVGTLAIRNLDAEALLVLYTIIHDVFQSGNTEDPTVLFGSMGRLFMLIPQVLAKSPEIVITEALESTMGNVQGDMSIRLNGATIATFLKVPALISALQARANIVISKKLLKKILSVILLFEIQQEELKQKGINATGAADLVRLQNKAEAASRKLISTLVYFGLLAKAGKNYRLHADYRDNKLKVNGQEIPLPPPFGTTMPSQAPVPTQ
jgi:uncharacterized protein YdgA (DUF945 family)